MLNKDFCHLHLHTQYSLLDGFGTAAMYAKRASELGFTHMAITDHGGVDGVIEFQKACKEEGIKSIIGCEGYIVPDISVKEKEKKYHITLLVKNEVGWKNLLQLLTIANIQGFYYKPRFDPQTLLDYCEGLVVMSACASTFLNMGNVIEKPSRPARGRRLDMAPTLDTMGIDLMLQLKERTDVAIEIMPLDLKEQIEVNKMSIEIAKENDIMLVATNDCHYPLAEHSKLQEVLLCMQTKSKWSNPDRWKFDIDDLYLKTADEMIDSFAEQGVVSREDVGVALLNTMTIAELCDFEIEAREPNLPRVHVSKYPDFSEDDQIIRLVLDGLDSRAEDHEWIKNDIAAYQERIEEELEQIMPKFTRYFLVVWELVHWCEKEKIMVGPGRGSSGGCLVAYCLGITDVDPLKYDLVFSRFISPGRIDLPDIDMDFEDRRREDVKKHLADIYGKWNVIEVSTFLKMHGRGAIRDVSRVFDIPLYEVKKAAECIVTRSGGDVRADFSIEDAFNTFEDGIAFKAKYPEVTKMAMSFEGQIKSAGRHAAATCVSETDLRLGENANFVVRNKKNVCNWAKEDAEYMGLMKLDILGLNSLTILSETKDLVKDRHGININYNLIDLDDERLYVEFIAGNTIGIFQFSSNSMMKLCRDIKGDCFDEVVALNALHRPGALRSGFTQIYRDRKFGAQDVEYAHPWIEGITKDTQGLIIYQEQAMRLMYELGGLTWKTADTIRKVISKSKGVEEFMKFEQQFIDGCKERDTLNKAEAMIVFGELKNMGSYSFNKCLRGVTSLIRSAAGKHSKKQEITVEELYKRWNSKAQVGTKYRDPKRGLKIMQVDPDGRVRPAKIKAIHRNGTRRTIARITTESGKQIDATMNHRFLTDKGYVLVGELKVGDLMAIMGEKEEHIKKGEPHNQKTTYDGCGFQKGKDNISYIDGRAKYFKEGKKAVIKRADGKCENCKIEIEGVCECCHQKIKYGRPEIAHIENIEQCDFDYSIYHSHKNLKYLCNPCHKKLDYKKGERKVRHSIGKPVALDPITSIEIVKCGEYVYDVEMDTEQHNFIANGFVSHNSHAVEYGMIAVWMMYLKINYPVEFMATLLSYGPAGKKHELINEAKRLGVNILLPDINLSTAKKWKIDDDGNLLSPFLEIKGIGEVAATEIIRCRDDAGPYKSPSDLESRVPKRKVNVKVRRLLEETKAYESPESKTFLPEEELEALSQYFDFELSNDPLYRFRGIFKILDQSLGFINLCDSIPMGNELGYYYGRMESLKVGYRQAVKQTSNSSDFGSLGGVYGHLKDDTDFKMLIFGNQIYDEKKSIVEHCEGQAIITLANNTDDKEALKTQAAWFSDELTSGNLEGLDAKLGKESEPPADLSIINDCDACELREECERPTFPKQGECNIMIVGEMPTKADNDSGYVFCGRPAEVLFRKLDSYGLDREMFYLTNVIKCWPSRTKKPKKKHVNACKRILSEEIAVAKPFLVLSLGNLGRQFFDGEEAGIIAVNGTTKWNMDHNCWVTYSISPSMVAYSEENMPLLDASIAEFANKVSILF